MGKTAAKRQERERRRFPANGMGFVVAPVLWAAYFALLYATQGAGCALAASSGEGETLLRLVLGVLVLATAAAIALFAVWSYRAWRRIAPDEPVLAGGAGGASGFLAHGALLNAGIFLLATLWVGLPVVLVDPCRGSFG